MISLLGDPLRWEAVGDIYIYIYVGVFVFVSRWLLMYSIVSALIIYLAGGLEHLDYIFPFSWEQSSQLTFIFFRGVQTTNQLCVDRISIPRLVG